MQATLTLLYLLLTAAYVAFLWINHRRLAASEPPIRAAIWSYSDVWPMLHGVAFITVVGTSIVAFKGIGVHGKNLLDFWSVIFPSTLAQNAGMVVMTVLCVCSVYRISKETVGFQFNFSELRKGLLIGIPTSICLIIVTLIIMGLAVMIFGEAAVNAFVKQSSLMNQSELIMKSIKTPLAMGGFVVMVSVFAPIGEEFFFRGWLFNLIKARSAKIGLACWLSGLLFATLHIAPLAVMVIMPLGAWLAWNYHKSGNIWKNIGIHSSYNLMMLVIPEIAKALGHNIDKAL